MKNTKKNNAKKEGSWFSDKCNVIFIVFLIAVIGINLYYFSITKNQPLWWDEADYMNMARTWLGADYWNLADDVTRPILFPAVAGLFMLFGLGESSIRFFVMLTGIASVCFLYGIGKLLFNKKIALIASFLLGFFWSFIFYSFRLLVDVPVAMLWLATIYFFFNAYFNDKNWKHFALAGLFLGLSFLMKFSSIALVGIFAIYLIINERFILLKNRKIWVFFITALLFTFPFFIYQYSLYGDPLQFNKVVAATGNPSANNIQDNITSLMRQIYKDDNSIFKVIAPLALVFFILGLLWMLFCISSSKNEFLIKKTKSNNYLFLLLWIIISLVFFARLISADTSYLDERYYFVFYPAIFLIIGVGLEFLHKILKKYNAQVATWAIIAILLFSAYQNIIRADQIIKLKKDSFLQLKLAGEYIKANTNQNDTIFLVEEQAEVTYYAQRRYVNIGYNSSEEIKGEMDKYEPKYVFLSFYYSIENDKRPIEFVLSNRDLFIPVKTYGPYIDENQKLPIAIIFRVNPIYYKL